METLTVVIPVFNEIDSLPKSLPIISETLAKVRGVSIRLLIVDDGSSDASAEWLREYCDESPNTAFMSLTRNFGKEAAILAGLQQAEGDAVIVMDSDLQHPPDLIPKMVEIWRQGVYVVDACKSSRGRESKLSAFLAVAFYHVFGRMAQIDVQQSSDFKLLDRRVVDVYCSLPERKRFFRGLTAWMGFSSARVYFDVPDRLHGSSTWTRLKLLRLSVDALTGFSTGALHLITLLGLVSLVVSIVIGSISLYHKLVGVAVDGFTTVILIVLLLGSFIMVGLGIIGIYLEQIFTEVKGRPPYLIDQRKGSSLRKSE